MKVIPIILFILVLASLSYADSCQYPQEEIYQETQRVLVYSDSDVKAGDDLLISGFEKGEIASFVITNPNDFKIMVVLNFSIEGTGAGSQEFGKWINPGSSEPIRHPCNEGEIMGNCSIPRESLNYYVAKPKVMYPKDIQVDKVREICPLFDDGKSCNSNEQCGSKRCVLGTCSTDALCYQGDCGCGENQTQCSNNQLCVDNGYLNNSEKPICSATECKTGNINKDGLCDEKIEDYILYLMIGVAVLIVLFFGGSGFFKETKRRHENTKLERINAEIEKIREDSEKINRLKKEIHLAKQLEEKLENQHKTIDSQRIEIKQKEKDLQELENTKQQRLENIKEIDSNWEKEFEKVKKVYGIEYWRPPPSRYPCYVNRGIKTHKYIHRHKAEKEIYDHHKDYFLNKYPGMTFNQLVVHHIDKNPEHFRIKNLCILNRSEHRRINHSSFPEGNLEKGMAELRRLGLTNPHLKFEVESITGKFHKKEESKDNHHKKRHDHRKRSRRHRHR
ncbi:hypothetical protein HOD05_02250 [Candidatus Woesearchaeota archaeon]|nr:hypothetical protein [Candidatus Woesearchaeota archaeon]MBT4150354.1 hypothetical protein [Candidatus Woesearchaeota archaeon]MBT4434017.1 hypothetical protein [Candidatus Woesearchaeota archaeon]